MSLVKLQFLAASLLLMLSGGFYTMSYFSDLEGTTANAFSASLLDQDVAGQPIDGLLCNLNDRVDTVLYTGNLGPMAFAYGFSVENATGTLCSGLSARLLSDESGMLYDGPLLALGAEEIELAGNTADELFLELRLSPGATESGSCTFDTSWQAAQFMGTVLPGYSDQESITHTISGSATGEGNGCVPPGDTVKLEITKAISGDDQGYELSDFFYRVIGEGIDAVVPHGGMIPLPVGVYTIEELVPEGFVKEDWRIGWYGQCERGDTFVTSITIDEGNVDHGILYCQADNQYRPDQRTRTHSREDVIVISTESEGETTSTEHEREETREERQERETETETETTSTSPEAEEESAELEVIEEPVEEELVVEAEEDVREEVVEEEEEDEPEPEPELEPEPEPEVEIAEEPEPEV